MAVAYLLGVVLLVFEYGGRRDLWRRVKSVKVGAPWSADPFHGSSIGQDWLLCFRDNIGTDGYHNLATAR